MSTQKAAMQAALIERLQYWADDAFELQPGEIARMRADIRQAANEIADLGAALAEQQAEPAAEGREPAP